jgi:hypothetical protein
MGNEKVEHLTIWQQHADIQLCSRRLYRNRLL